MEDHSVLEEDMMEEDIPPVPLPTYLWEEVRRSKSKGFYPWTHVFKPPFDEDAWIREKDHEYEPINPKDPPIVLQISELENDRPVTPTKVFERRNEYEPNYPKDEQFSELQVSERENDRPVTPTKVFERRYIKIPNEDAIIIPLHGDSDEDINPDRYVDKELTVHEVQMKDEEKDEEDQEEKQVTDRTLPPVITVSTPDSPKQESLPLEKSSKGMRTKLKSQAGDIKNKLRKMSTQKISLPDRPKIKFPERPKINFPDRPQFLKEKPKFLTEKPKFLTEKPKFLTERPKFSFPDKSKFKIPERFTFERQKKQPAPKQKRPNPSSLRRPLRDTVTVTSSDSSRNIFETLKFKTYPRFLTRKKREKERAEQLGTSLDTESSPSTPPNSRKQGGKWVGTYRDIKFVDDEIDEKLEAQDEEGYEENTEPFHDNYIKGALQLGVDEPVKAKIDSSSDVMDSDKEQQSSGSESMRRRAGVLEEIDSDEFFLRQKGLSREDMDMSRYLSKEIRDAFRSPKNALAHMDSTDYEDERPSPEMRFEEMPKPPERKKSLKSLQSEKISEFDFNTFPSRPNRRKDSDFGSRDEFEDMRKPPRKYRSKSDSRQRSTPSLARSRSQGIDAPGTPHAPKRRKSSKSLSRSIHDDSLGEIPMDDVHREIDAHDSYRVPMVPFRKSRSRGTSLADEDRTSRGADSTDLPDDRYFQEQRIAEDSILTALPARVTNFEPPEDNFGYATVMKEKKTKTAPSRPPPPPSRHKRQLHLLQSQLHTIKNHGKNIFFTYPRRAIKSLHKAPIRPVRNYSTLGPSRPPRRTREYKVEPVYVDDEIEFDDEVEEKHEETRDLQRGEVVERIQGRPLPPPPRPPRKSKDDENLFQSSEQTDTLINEEISEEKSVEISDEKSEEKTEEKHEEKPVEKPKGHKRLGYKRSKGEDFLSSIGKMMSFGDKKQTEEEKHLETTNTSQQTSFEVAEVSVSIQTDPLPEGFIVDDAPIEFDGISQRSVSKAETRQAYKESSIEIELLPHNERVQIQERLDFERCEEPKSFESREATPPPLPERSIPSLFRNLPTFPVSFPDKLHLTELDVDKLNVNELQASKLQVSDMETNALHVTELNSKGGNLVVNGIELPPDFFKKLAAQFPVAAPAPSPGPELPQPLPHLRRVLTPPPPIIVQHSPTFSDISHPHAYQASTIDQLPKPKTTKSRGRKSPTRVIDDSEDELASILPEREKKEREERSKKEKKTETPRSLTPLFLETPSQPKLALLPPTQLTDPSALDLIKQLLTIWIRNVYLGTGSFIEGINSMFPEGEKRRDAQIAAVILVVLVAGLILIGFGVDNSVHHHHWDYLPPR